MSVLSFAIFESPQTSHYAYHYYVYNQISARHFSIPLCSLYWVVFGGTLSYTTFSVTYQLSLSNCFIQNLFPFLDKTNNKAIIILIENGSNQLRILFHYLDKVSIQFLEQIFMRLTDKQGRIHGYRSRVRVSKGSDEKS